MKICIIRETKTPQDRRVPFSPDQLARLKSIYPEAGFDVQSSDLRCFRDGEYRDKGLDVIGESGPGAAGDLAPYDVLFGVKEVEINDLVPGKTYFFFSHTAKEQPYNRQLLQEVLKRKITLVDYEYLTDSSGMRQVAFGRWAGIVGAYNGLRAYGERYRQFRLKPAHECHDLEEMKHELAMVSELMLQLPPVRVLVTGGGRVASGAMETMSELGIATVSPSDFLAEEFDKTVQCRIDPRDYVRHRGGMEFDLQHFFSNPGEYESTFKPFTKVTDLFVACHFWDPASPVFMTTTDMKEPDFHIKVIADVSCDINGPIPSTIRASTIANPFYGYNPLTGSETQAFNPGSITVMAVDNLPGELPRDASVDFGEMLMKKIIPSLLGNDREGIIGRATIAEGGRLRPAYSYLEVYLKGL